MNELEKMKNEMNIKYQSTDNIVEDIRIIINSTTQYVRSSVNIALVVRNWLIGKRIAEEELKGKERADYGAEVIKSLSKNIKDEYGAGFNKTNLYNFLKFYQMFPEIFHSVSGKSTGLLSWTHYRVLLQVFDKIAREWYAKEAYEQTWSVRTLQRNISTQYYNRLLLSQIKEPVIDEMQEKTAEFQKIDKLEFVKNPVIAEFLGYSMNEYFTETDLETAIIDNLQKFLMELRKRICFCCKTKTYSYRKRRLLYRFSIL